MNKLITTLAAAVLALSALPAVATTTTTVKASVNGMVCAFCAQGIEKRLSQLPAVASVFVDLKHRIVAVEVKPGQTLDPAQVSAEIVEAGYAVTQLETLAQPLAEIRAQAKALK